MKRFFASLLLIFATSLAFSQTTVTLSATDTDSQAWASATYNVYLTSTMAGTPQPVALNTGTLNAAGSTSFSLSANTYTFVVCAQVSSSSAGTYGNTQPFCTSTSVAISGGSQSVSLTPAAIRMPVLVGVTVRAYADAEVTGALPGSRYYNLILGLDRIWNGTAWIDEGTTLPVAFASLPACSANLEGQKRQINNSNSIVWGATAAGGGASHVSVFCDGTNWTVFAK